MAGGGFAVDAPANGFDGKMTLSVVITCIVAASSGLIFGYDVGVSGGVTTMVPFLEKFFPSILRKAAKAEVNMYCVYDNQMLTLFTSSLYLAGLVSSLAASRVTMVLGRRNTIVLGGAVFLAGGAINGGAQNIAMLILGRILLGLGVGFTNQAAPLYLSEMAPAKWRGAFNTGFQFFLSVGVLTAGCINYATATHTWGWRVSLGLAVVPATVMTVGAILITDTPSSLVQRGKIDQARKALRKVRGSHVDVEPELEELQDWSQNAKSMQQEPFMTIFERQYRPHLLMAILIPLFQQLTGINIVAFYSPNLFQSVGFGHHAALLSTIIIGLVNLASLLVSTSFVDKFGRRFLFITGGVLMLVCQCEVVFPSDHPEREDSDDEVVEVSPPVTLVVALARATEVDDRGLGRVGQPRPHVETTQVEVGGKELELPADAHRKGMVDPSRQPKAKIDYGTVEMSGYEWVDGEVGIYFSKLSDQELLDTFVSLEKCFGNDDEFPLLAEACVDVGLDMDFVFLEPESDEDEHFYAYMCWFEDLGI
uniref:Sugar transport protein 5 n=1 Tax=Cajanus cajan TaxID=3821 RepID=A0A151U8L0_CAJCA|nr:Sugar transport protein 5 [Cajanus cajan]